MAVRVYRPGATPILPAAPPSAASPGYCRRVLRRPPPLPRADEGVLAPPAAAQPEAQPGGWEESARARPSPGARALPRDDGAPPWPSPPAPPAEGWQAARATRNVARATAPGEQPSGTPPGALPLVPPLAEGWQSFAARPTRPARTPAFDAPLSFRFAPQPPAPAEGWQTASAAVPPARRPRRPADDLPSAPAAPAAAAAPQGWEAAPAARPAAPVPEAGTDLIVVAVASAAAAPQGWYAERAPARPAARTTPRDEQASGTLLRTPPLAPPFREGWQALDVRPARPTRSPAFDVPLHFRFVPTPLAFPEGWQGDVRAVLVRPPARSLTRDEPSSGTLFRVPPLAPAFREGWQALDVRPARPPATRTSDAPLYFGFALVPLPRDGWQALDARPGLPTFRRREDVFAFAPPLPTRPWGWEAVAVRGRPWPFRGLREDGQLPAALAGAVPFGGWQAHPPLFWRPRWRRAPEPWQYLAPVARLAPFPEGWQPQDVRPAPPLRTLAHQAESAQAPPPPLAMRLALARLRDDTARAAGLRDDTPRAATLRDDTPRSAPLGP